MKLEIERLCKKYGNMVALENFSITMEEGVYGLLGPNGAGKSTIMNLLTDNLKRTDGNILFDGKEIISMGKEYREILGYVPQQQGFYEHFSAEVFLKYIGKLKGCTNKDLNNQIPELLKALNLYEKRFEKIGSFSGGMKQRILIAQALLGNPKIIIMDEPTAGVDPQERIHIRNFISQIAKNRIILIATHIVSDIESIAKEILLIKKGKMIEKGTTCELIEKIQPYVYEIEVDDQQQKDLPDKYLISNIRQNAEGLIVKIISKEPPKEYAYTKALANLEDVYLFYSNWV